MPLARLVKKKQTKKHTRLTLIPELQVDLSCRKLCFDYLEVSSSHPDHAELPVLITVKTVHEWITSDNPQ